jgi:hypothetical protein
LSAAFEKLCVDPPGDPPFATFPDVQADNPKKQTPNHPTISSATQSDATGKFVVGTQTDEVRSTKNIVIATQTECVEKASVGTHTKLRLPSITISVDTQTDLRQPSITVSQHPS